MKRILITGLPGSGKTTLALALCKRLDAIPLDGDAVRWATENDNFSMAGRIKQARTMRALADMFENGDRDVVASFVAPTNYIRELFDPHFTIFMDTIIASEYRDTNNLWEPPFKPDVVVHDFNRTNELLTHIVSRLYPVDEDFNWLKPTALMVGRFQPWHAGHRALFEEALRRYGQVAILIRNMPLGPDNPYTVEQVWDMIRTDLKDYDNKFALQIVPNTAAVVYGRDVGYKIDRMQLPADVEAIRATDLRVSMELMK